MAIEAILNACHEGQTSIFVTGRPLTDLHLDESGNVRPLLSTLVRRMWTDHQLVTVRCSLALGPVPEMWPLDPTVRREFQSKLQAAGLGMIHNGEADPGLSRYPHERALGLLRTLHTATIEGRPLPGLFVCFEFSEDLMPATSQTETAVQFSELVCLLAGDFRLRGQNVFLAFHGDEPRTDPRVLRALPHVELPQPDVNQKRLFAKALLASELRSGAYLEEGLDIDGVANLTAGTPNLGLEQIVLGSSRTGRAVTHAELVRQKRDDVVRLSHGTLTVLDDERVNGLRLAGRNVRRPMELLMQWAQMLKRGTQLTPVAVILAGGISSGKTDIALLSARHGQVPTYGMPSPKGSLVGQSEENVRRQFKLLLDLSPSIGFIDEFTEAIRMRRDGLDLDSGASKAIVAEYLSALSSRAREGRSMIIATTNRPHDLDPAFVTRCFFVPVIAPLREDWPEILATIASNLSGECKVRPDEITEAAFLFYEKGLTPREARAVLRNTMAATARALDAHMIAEAAQDACEARLAERIAGEFGDLWAIQATSQKSFLPWHNQPGYPFPPYLQRLMKPDGAVDREKLHARITELQKSAKL